MSKKIAAAEASAVSITSSIKLIIVEGLRWAVLLAAAAGSLTVMYSVYMSLGRMVP